MQIPGLELLIQEDKRANLVEYLCALEIIPRKAFSSQPSELHYLQHWPCTKFSRLMCFFHAMASKMVTAWSIVVKRICLVHTTKCIIRVASLMVQFLDQGNKQIKAIRFNSHFLVHCS